MLDKIQKLDVIQRETALTQCVNSLGTVRKKPNKQGGHYARVHIDMRRANDAIVCERHPVPTIDEKIAEMVGRINFSKINFNMAYDQIELHPGSR